MQLSSSELKLKYNTLLLFNVGKEYQAIMFCADILRQKFVINLDKVL